MWAEISCKVHCRSSAPSKISNCSLSSPSWNSNEWSSLPTPSNLHTKSARRWETIPTSAFRFPTPRGGGRLWAITTSLRNRVVICRFCSSVFPSTLRVDSHWNSWWKCALTSDTLSPSTTKNPKWALSANRICWCVSQNWSPHSGPRPNSAARRMSLEIVDANSLCSSTLKVCSWAATSPTPTNTFCRVIEEGTNTENSGRTNPNKLSSRTHIHKCRHNRSTSSIHRVSNRRNSHNLSRKHHILCTTDSQCQWMCQCYPRSSRPIFWVKVELRSRWQRTLRISKEHTKRKFRVSNKKSTVSETTNTFTKTSIIFTRKTHKVTKKMSKCSETKGRVSENNLRVFEMRGTFPLTKHMVS